MVRRHHNIEFAGGAYVFPGGKVDADDLNHAPDISTYPPGYGELIVTAIREVFEESGLVIGKFDNIQKKVAQLLSGELTFAEFMAIADVNKFMDDIVPFAAGSHQKIIRSVFDTRFFLAKAPSGQVATPDLSEVVEAKWVEPIDFINKIKVHMMFPTIMNLKLLGQANSVEQAMSMARARKIISVEPKIIDGKRVIDPAAGYGEIDQGNIHPGVRG